MGNVGKEQPIVPIANIDPVTGQCIPGTFWNGVACVELVNGGLPMPDPTPIYIEEIAPPIADDYPVYVDPVYDYKPVDRIPPPQPPVYIAPPIDEEPIYDYGEPVTQVCPEGYTLVGNQCVRNTRPYEEVPTPMEPAPTTCPPGYAWHPVSGDCVPVQQGTDIISVTNEPTATPTNTTPTTPSTNPLASLLDANGKLFGFDPLYVGLAAAGVVLFLVVKD